MLKLVWPCPADPVIYKSQKGIVATCNSNSRLCLFPTSFFFSIDFFCAVLYTGTGQKTTISRKRFVFETETRRMIGPFQPWFQHSLNFLAWSAFGDSLMVLTRSLFFKMMRHNR